MKKLISITLLFSMQIYAGLANAAVWQAISGNYNGAQLYATPNFTFEDGVYKGSQASDQILTDNINSSQGTKRFSFLNLNASYPFSTSPPQVNLNNHTIDVSSLFFTGWSITNNGTTYEPVIGWNVGPKDPVSFVNNVDGSYTATWIMPTTLNHTDSLAAPGKPMSITFQAAVPLPSAILLFGGGIGSMIGFFGLKKKKR